MLCPVVRWQISSALDGGARGRMCRAHLERCDRCRTYAARLDALHARLAGGAGEAPRPEQTRGRRTSRALAGGGLALAGAAALALYVASPERAPERPAPAASAAPLAPQPARRSSDATGAVVMHASAFLAAPPLREELTALASDGERGARAILDLAGVRRSSR